MIIKLDATRIYGSHDQYGDVPRAYSGSISPIRMDNYPTEGEQLQVYLGAIPTEVIQAHTMGNARNKVLLETMFGGVVHDNLDEAVNKEASKPGYEPDVSQYNWYVTFVLTKLIQVDDSLEKQSSELYEQLPSYIESFDSYSAEQFDLLTTYLITVMEKGLFSNRFAQDRVFFSLPAKPMLYLPKQTMTIQTSVKRAEDAIGLEAIESLISSVAKLPRTAHKWLKTFKYWYVIALRETDPWKKFQWSFLSLEILTNKLVSDFYREVVSSLHFNNRSSDQLPLSELVWEQSRLPLKSKFAIVATYLCPDTASEDVRLFSEYKSFRDKIAHGEIVDESDLPLSVCEFVTKYLIVALRQRLGTASDA